MAPKKKKATAKRPAKPKDRALTESTMGNQTPEARLMPGTSTSAKSAADKIGTKSKSRKPATKPLVEWHEELRPIWDLKDFDQNPRAHMTKGMTDLERSIKKFGLAQPIVINTDGTICGGHARRKVLEGLGLEQVKCYVPDKKLTPKQFKELNVRLNRNIGGEWDFDILANSFEVDDLTDWGFEDWELGIETGDGDGGGGGGGDGDPKRWMLTVECISKKKREELLDELTERGLDCSEVKSRKTLDIAASPIIL